MARSAPAHRRQATSSDCITFGRKSWFSASAEVANAEALRRIGFCQRASRLATAPNADGTSLGAAYGRHLVSEKIGQNGVLGERGGITCPDAGQDARSRLEPAI